MALDLDHVVLRASDPERTCAFYRRVLGAEIVELDMGRFGLRLGRRQLNVHGPGSTPHPVAARPAQAGSFDACFVWPGTPEGALEHLRHCGIEPELGPVPRIGARGEGTSVYFRDPDGNLLELLSYGR
jgi:catechol 2,3-dioxygenase-like lactoylglutathione lyase family enzyme